MIDSPPSTDLKHQTGNWVLRHLDLFQPAGLVSSCDAPSTLKVIGELLLACELLSRTPGSDFLQLRVSGISSLWDALAQGALITQVIAHDSDYLPMLSLYRILKKHGFSSSELDMTCQAVALDPYAHMRDWSAGTRLELLQALQHLGFDLQNEIFTVFSRSWLSRSNVSEAFDPALAYYVTHLVFCMTDYGVDTSWLGPEELRRLSVVLPRWLKASMHYGNADLAAELIIAMDCIGLHRVAATYLPSLQHTLPKGAEIAVGTENGDLAEQRLRLFLQNYHTMLVAFMASILPGCHGHAKMADSAARGDA